MQADCTTTTSAAAAATLGFPSTAATDEGAGDDAAVPAWHGIAPELLERVLECAFAARDHAGFREAAATCRHWAACARNTAPGRLRRALAASRQPRLAVSLFVGLNRACAPEASQLWAFCVAAHLGAGRLRDARWFADAMLDASPTSCMLVADALALRHHLLFMDMCARGALDCLRFVAQQPWHAVQQRRIGGSESFVKGLVLFTNEAVKRLTRLRATEWFATGATPAAIQAGASTIASTAATRAASTACTVWTVWNQGHAGRWSLAGPIVLSDGRLVAGELCAAAGGHIAVARYLDSLARVSVVLRIALGELPPTALPPLQSMIGGRILAAAGALERRQLEGARLVMHDFLCHFTRAADADWLLALLAPAPRAVNATASASATAASAAPFGAELVKELLAAPALWRRLAWRGQEAALRWLAVRAPPTRAAIAGEAWDALVGAAANDAPSLLAFLWHCHERATAPPGAAQAVQPAAATTTTTTTTTTAAAAPIISGETLPPAAILRGKRHLVLMTAARARACRVIEALWPHAYLTWRPRARVAETRARLLVNALHLACAWARPEPRVLGSGEHALERLLSTHTAGFGAAGGGGVAAIVSGVAGGGAGNVPRGLETRELARRRRTRAVAESVRKRARLELTQIGAASRAATLGGPSTAGNDDGDDDDDDDDDDGDNGYGDDAGDASAGPARRSAADNVDAHAPIVFGNYLERRQPADYPALWARLSVPRENFYGGDDDAWVAQSQVAAQARLETARLLLRLFAALPAAERHPELWRLCRTAEAADATIGDALDAALGRGTMAAWRAMEQAAGGAPRG